MSSRSGGRARGTDGSDFLHRERVADHYSVSVVNKARMKFTITLHFAIFLMMIGRLLPNILTLLNIAAPDILKNIDLPDPAAWEYAWSVSFLAALFGLLSLPKNRVFLIQQYIIGTVMFGFFPIVFGLYDLSDDISAYVNSRASSSSILGFPAVILHCVFIMIAIQIHIFGTYFACQLLSAWKDKRSKTK